MKVDRSVDWCVSRSVGSGVCRGICDKVDIVIYDKFDEGSELLVGGKYA